MLGDVYQDDGLTFNFRHGDYLRLHVTCKLEADGALRVDFAAQEGTFKPWWTQYRIEVVGSTPTTVTAPEKLFQSGKTDLGWAVTMSYSTSAKSITFH